MRACLAPLFAAAALAVAIPAFAVTNFTVINNGTGISPGSAWKIDGINNPQLHLIRGETYNFNVNAPGHAFWIETAPGIGAANPYNNGTTGQGAETSTLTFVVPYNAPTTLYYNCEFHSLMQGQIRTTTGAPGVTPITAGALVVLLAGAGVFVARRRLA